MKKVMLVILLVATLSLAFSTAAFAMTQEEAVQWAENQIGKTHGRGQCTDLVYGYTKELFKWPYGVNPNKWPEIDLPEGWERFEYSEGFIPAPGDVMIKTGKGTEHVAIVVSATSTSLVTIDQNVNSGGAGSSAQKWPRKNYEGVWGFIRPPFNGLPGPQVPIKTGDPRGREPKVVLLFTVDQDEYSVNGVITPMDVAPTIIKGTTFLPVKYLAEPVGASTAWSDAEKKVTVEYSETHRIELWIGKHEALVQGIYRTIVPEDETVTPVIINGRAMMPMRFIAEKLGCTVDWLEETKQVEIKKY